MDLGLSLYQLSHPLQSQPPFKTRSCLPSVGHLRGSLGASGAISRCLHTRDGGAGQSLWAAAPERRGSCNEHTGVECMSERGSCAWESRLLRSWARDSLPAHIHHHYYSITSCRHNFLVLFIFSSWLQTTSDFYSSLCCMMGLLLTDKNLLFLDLMPGALNTF